MRLLDIKPGDRIEVRNSAGEWHPKIARSKPFLNRGLTFGGAEPWLVVQVDHPSFSHPINWPLADVRFPEGNDPATADEVALIESLHDEDRQ